MDVVAVVPVLALDEVYIVEGPLPPLLQPVQKAPPRPPGVLEPLRLVLPVEGEGVAAALVPEQSQTQLQTVHPRPAHGGVPGRTEDLVLLRPLIGRITGGQPGPDAPALLHQRPRPLPHAHPDRFSAHIVPPPVDVSELDTSPPFSNFLFRFIQAVSAGGWKVLSELHRL